MARPLTMGQLLGDKSGSATSVSPKLVVICAAASVMFGCFGGAYAVPVFFPVLSKTLAISPTHLTALFSITGAVSFSLGAASGPFADRHGPQIPATVGGAVLALGLFAAAHSTDERTFECQSALKRDPESASNRDPHQWLRSGRPRSPRRGPARVAQCPHERRSDARGEALWAPGGDPRAAGLSFGF